LWEEVLQLTYYVVLTTIFSLKVVNANVQFLSQKSFIRRKARKKYRKSMTK